MAFIKPDYTDDAGVTHTNSYWRAVDVFINIIDLAASTHIYGYKDEAAFNSKKNNIGSKFYTVTGQAFIDMMTNYQTGGGGDVFELAYQVAKATKDQDGPNNTKISFFEDSTEV